MSIHKSLFIGGALVQERSVWTRRERISNLMKEGRWDRSEDSVFGLPKVRTRFKVMTRKQLKAKAAEEAAGAAAVAAPEEAGAAEAPKE